MVEYNKRVRLSLLFDDKEKGPNQLRIQYVTDVGPH